MQEHEAPGAVAGMRRALAALLSDPRALEVWRELQVGYELGGWE